MSQFEDEIEIIDQEIDMALANIAEWKRKLAVAQTRRIEVTRKRIAELEEVIS